MSKKMMDRNYQKYFKLSGYKELVEDLNYSIFLYNRLNGKNLSLDMIAIDIGSEMRNFCSCGYVSSHNKTDVIVCPNCESKSCLQITDTEIYMTGCGLRSPLKIYDNQSDLVVDVYSIDIQYSDDETEIVLLPHRAEILSIFNGVITENKDYLYSYDMVQIIANSNSFMDLLDKAEKLNLRELLNGKHSMRKEYIIKGLLQANQYGSIDFDSWIGNEELFIYYCANNSLDNAYKFLTLDDMLDELVLPDRYPGSKLEYLKSFNITPFSWSNSVTPDKMTEINQLTKEFEEYYSEKIQDAIIFLTIREQFKLKEAMINIDSLIDRLNNVSKKEKAEDIIVEFINSEISRLSGNVLLVLNRRISKLINKNIDVSIDNLKTKKYNILNLEDDLEGYKMHPEKEEIFKKFVLDYPRDAYSMFANRRQLTKEEIIKFDKLKDRLIRE